MRRPTFHQPNKLRDPELGIDFAQQVNMIRHDFQFNNLGLGVDGNLVDDFFTSNRDSFVQYLATIFRTENDVVLARVHDVSIRFVLLLRGHMNSISRRVIYCQAGGCLISPGLKAGGLRHFC
jgi:hypothetical protein